MKHGFDVDADAYLEGENAPDEDEDGENQAHVVGGHDVLFVRERSRLRQRHTEIIGCFPHSFKQIKIVKLVGTGSHQLLEVVLHRIGVNHHANGYQRVEDKVKDLVAEEWNDPGCMLLRAREPEQR